MLHEEYLWRVSVSYAMSSGNSANCPYCKAEGMGKTKEESVQDEACGGK
jgi:hypothetical protein